MEFNILVSIIAALVPLVIGFIWYNPKVFGTAWMNACGFSKEDLKGGNMLKIFLLTFILSIMIAFSLNTIVIHQFGFFQSLMNEPNLMVEGTELNLYAKDYMERFGTNFRDFGHGALHGTIAGFFIVLPIIGINALFERRSFKYIAIHAGYWVICLALMGGIICQFA